MLAGRPVGSTPISSPAWGHLLQGSLHAVVDAIAHIDVKPPWLTKERFVLRAPAPIAVAGGVVLRIRLRFHNHAPEQAAVLLAFHQQATDEVGGDQLGGAGEEGLGERWGVLGDELLGGYGSGCWSLQCADDRATALTPMTAREVGCHYLQQ